MYNESTKKVVHYQNEDCPERCLVRLYKLYNSKCPDDRPKDAFYLKPLKCPKGAVWYQRSAIGHNILSKMVSQTMAKSGIEGRYSNHSLRSTATSRLFHAGLDEQLIMLRTGHSSTKGVRTYKRANEQQLEETSNILNNKKYKPSDKENVPPVQSVTSSGLAAPTVSLSSSLPMPLSLNSCNNVTVNIYNK